jgi:hypothetical protein
LEKFKVKLYFLFIWKKPTLEMSVINISAKCMKIELLLGLNKSKKFLTRNLNISSKKTLILTHILNLISGKEKQKI